MLKTYSELLLNGAGVGLRVQAVHVVVDRAELTGRNGGVATETCLQNGIMDEDILLLQKTASSLRIYQTPKIHDNRQHLQKTPIRLILFYFTAAAAELHELVFSEYLLKNSMTFSQPYHDYSLPLRHFL